MTEKEITERFLSLFSRGWDDPAAHQGFRELRAEVSGQGQWGAIIDARLKALEKQPAETIALLKEILAEEPRNVCASLMLGRILSMDDKQPEEALKIFDSLVLQGCRDQPFPEWLEALTQFHRGVALGKMGKSVEAIAAYDDLVKRFGESTELRLRELVATALRNKGVTLGDMGKSEEGVAVHDDVVKRFGESKELPLQEQVADALVNKGVALGQMGKSEEEIAAYDDLVKRFGESKELPLQEQVATALFNKGATLGQVSKSEEAIAVYDDVVKRFGQSTELALQKRVAKTLFNKGVRLGAMGRSEEENAVYDDLIERFGESKETPPSRAGGQSHAQQGHDSRSDG